MSPKRFLFREVNERIREFNASFGPESAADEILLCECGHADCAERLEVPADVYEGIRGDALRYLVVPGHEQPAEEQVVLGAPSYLVVATETRPL